MCKRSLFGVDCGIGGYGSQNENSYKHVHVFLFSSDK